MVPFDAVCSVGFIQRTTATTARRAPGGGIDNDTASPLRARFPLNDLMIGLRELDRLASRNVIGLVIADNWGLEPIVSV